MIDLIATNSFRWVQRAVANSPTVAVEARQVLQQRVKVMEQAGSSKERAYYVWLDVDGPAFSAVESDDERTARERIEAEAARGIKFVRRWIKHGE